MQSFLSMTENKDKKTKINTEENEKLKTQIDASIGIARSLISSWLPPLKPGEKLDDDEDDRTLANYSTGRPDRYVEKSFWEIYLFLN